MLYAGMIRAAVDGKGNPFTASCSVFDSAWMNESPAFALNGNDASRGCSHWLVLREESLKMSGSVVSPSRLLISRWERNWLAFIRDQSSGWRFVNEARGLSMEIQEIHKYFHMSLTYSFKNGILTLNTIFEDIVKKFGHPIDIIFNLQPKQQFQWQ